MRCANPECGEIAVDLSTGVLRLIELEVPTEERVSRSDGGFPVCSVPSRYFWLCPRCASFLRIARWTPEGTTLERKTAQRPSQVGSRILQFGQSHSHTPAPATRKTA